MSQPVWVQLVAASLFVGIYVVAVLLIADDWSDYVVAFAVFFTLVGFAVAVNKRQYPTKKRGFTRDADSDW